MTNILEVNIAHRQAQKLLEIFRGEVDDFFKLWPPDKTYFFSNDKKAFIAYGVRHGVAVCMGDPVGADQSILPLLQEFKAYCSDHALKMAFIQTTDKYQKAYHTTNLHDILIGADALIDLTRFVDQTIHNKYFRNVVNRFEKNQFSVRKHAPPHSLKFITELRAVSTSWLTLPHRKEWSFLTGRFDTEYLQQVTIYVLRDDKGNAQAFTNELPSFKPGVATIDLMRHRSNAPPNSIDFLFLRLIQSKQTEGYQSLNLGMSPLDGKPFVNDLPAKLLIQLYRITNRFIGFKGLHQFKSKYEPQWEPRYVWYSGTVFGLIQIGRAVSELLIAK